LLTLGICNIAILAFCSLVSLCISSKTALRSGWIFSCRSQQFYLLLLPNRVKYLRCKTTDTIVR